MPHKASSGSSGTQTHWPSSHLPGSHQDVIVPRFRTEKAWLGGPAAAPDASSPAGLEAGWGHGAAGPQLPITVQRTCRTFPCSQWGCRARARMGRGWGVRGPMAGLLRGLECERAGWGCAGRCERAGGRGRGGGDARGSGRRMRWMEEFLPGIRYPQSVHSAAASWAIRGARNAPLPSLFAPLSLNTGPYISGDSLLLNCGSTTDNTKVTEWVIQRLGSRAPAQKKAERPSRPLGGLHHPTSSQSVEKCLSLVVVFKHQMCRLKGLTPRKKRATREMCLQSSTPAHC